MFVEKKNKAKISCYVYLQQSEINGYNLWKIQMLNRVRMLIEIIIYIVLIIEKNLRIKYFLNFCE